MQRSLEDLEKILRSRVCSVCSDRLEDGSCGLEEPEDCALFRMLPQPLAPFNLPTAMTFGIMCAPFARMSA